MATHFSVLAWRTPGTREPGGLLSMGSHRVRHDWSDLAAAATRTLKMSSSWPNNSTLENSKKKMWNKKCLTKYVKVKVKVLVIQSCLILWNHMDCSPVVSSVHVSFQARILDWAAISFSRGSSQPRDQTYVSCVSRWILYHCTAWEARLTTTESLNVCRFIRHLANMLLLLLSRFSRVQLCVTP